MENTILNAYHLKYLRPKATDNIHLEENQNNKSEKFTNFKTNFMKTILKISLAFRFSIAIVCLPMADGNKS
ncbi:MAG: hypothetical protein IPQ19_11350 [Bacteroidetes bacterium]|nr:hypothetical protein [Bacteroidota bacterium]